MVGRVNPRLAGCLSLGWYYRIKKKKEKKLILTNVIILNIALSTVRYFPPPMLKHLLKHLLKHEGREGSLVKAAVRIKRKKKPIIINSRR